MSLLQNISPYDESIYLVHTFVCIKLSIHYSGYIEGI